MTVYFGTAAAPGIFVRVGEGGAIQKSVDPDYFPWVTVTSPTTADLFDVVWTGQSFVAVGASGACVRSLNGTAWSLVTSGTSQDLLGVAAGFPVVMAVGKAGTGIQSNDDGQTFAALTTGTTSDLYDVTVQDGYYIIVGDNSFIAYGELVVSGTAESIIFEGFTLAETLPIPPMTFESLAQDTMGFDEGLAGLFVSAGGNTHLEAVSELIALSGSAANAFDTVVSETIAFPHAATHDLEGEVHFAFVDENASLAGAVSPENLIDILFSEGIAFPHAATHDLEGEVHFAFADENHSFAGVTDGAIRGLLAVDERIGFANIPDVRQFRGLGEIIFAFSEDGIGLTIVELESRHKANLVFSESLSFDERAFDSFERIAEAFTLADTLVGGYHRTAEDALTFADDIATNMGYAMLLADTIAIAEDAIANQGYHSPLSDTLGLDEAAGTNIGYHSPISESLTLDENNAANVRVAAQASDALSLDDTGSTTFFLVATATDIMSLSAVVDPLAIINALASDSFAFSGVLARNGEVFDAWVVNPENKAVTTYRNFGFESMCSSAVGVYATDGTTIYELSGANDNGTAIDAWLKTAITDFGTAYLKNCERIYLGIRADGKMLLKTITNEIEENWYEVRLVQEGLHEARVKPGKGLKSRYWQFELRNIRGADFNVESMTLVPIRTGRRVSGRSN